MNDLKAGIIEILEDARAQIVQNIQKEGITASGRTESSFRVEEYDKGVKLIAGGKGTAPIHTLEIGYSGDNPPSNFTEIIAQWIIDKSIPYDKKPYKRKPSDKWKPKFSDEMQRGLFALAGAIAWGKIAKVGTDRYISPRNDIYSPVVQKAIEKISKFASATILENISKSASAKIIEQIKTN